MALVLRFFLLIELCIYIVSALWCHMVMIIPWVDSLALAFVAPFLISSLVTAITFAMAINNTEKVIKRWQWLRAFLIETISPIAFLSVYGPFDKLLLKDSTYDPSTQQAGPLLIFVHGYVSNRGIWWRYARMFKSLGYYVAAVELSPPLQSLEHFTKQLDNAITHHRNLTGNKRIILIAHSMGGLICRSWQANTDDQQLELIITLGSPHNGTRLAPLALGKCAEQMREKSDWNAKLLAHETAQMRKKIISIRSTQDNVVIPNSSSILLGASNFLYDGYGHCTTTTSGTIGRKVLELVQTTSHVAPSTRD